MQLPHLVSIDTLTIHPARRLRPPPNDGLVERMTRDIVDNGMHYPLLTHNGRVIDGETRLKSGREAGHEGVWVIEISADEAASIILSTHAVREHCTPSALAYIIFPLLEDALNQARQRRLDCLKASEKKKPTSLPVGNTVGELAEAKGVCRRLLFMAGALHKKFAARPKLKAEYEPKILSGEMGLGQVQQAMAGKIAGEEGRTTPKGDPTQLWLDLGKSMIARSGNEVPVKNRKRVTAQWCDEVADKMPEWIAIPFAKRLLEKHKPKTTQ